MIELMNSIPEVEDQFQSAKIAMKKIETEQELHYFEVFIF